MAVSFRKAGASDAAALRAIAREAYAHYVPRMGREPAPMTADYEALVADGFVTAAVEDGSILGFLVTYPRDGVLFVENVAVGIRGRGLGRALMEEAERLARGSGLTALELYTNEKMTENLDWYPRLGFLETDRRIEDGYARVYFLKPLV
ncbi:MAG: GNAT family N-acetyltransferase [Hyphomicrobiales bacterium]